MLVVTGLMVTPLFKAISIHNKGLMEICENWDKKKTFFREKKKKIRKSKTKFDRIGQSVERKKKSFLSPQLLSATVERKENKLFKLNITSLK